MEFSFRIGDQEYTVPQALTVSEFQTAICWDLEDIKNVKPFVASITGCPLHQLDLIDDVTFDVLLAACVMLLPKDGQLIRMIGVHKLMDLDSLSFGDFIDIDVYIADGITKHIVDLVTKLYGMTTDQAANTEVQKIWPTVIAVAKWRELVYKEHDEFFELSNAKGIDDSEFSINNLQLMWYEAVLALADHQFLNIQHVVERPYKEALNFLTWKKNEIAKQQLEQVKRKYDLQKRTR